MAHLEAEANNGVLRRLSRATVLPQNLKWNFAVKLLAAGPVLNPFRGR